MKKQTGPELAFKKTQNKMKTQLWKKVRRL